MLPYIAYIWRSTISCYGERLFAVVKWSVPKKSHGFCVHGLRRGFCTHRISDIMWHCTTLHLILFQHAFPELISDKATKLQIKKAPPVGTRRVQEFNNWINSKSSWSWFSVMYRMRPPVEFAFSCLKKWITFYDMTIVNGGYSGL